MKKNAAMNIQIADFFSSKTGKLEIDYFTRVTMSPQTYLVSLSKTKDTTLSLKGNLSTLTSEFVESLGDLSHITKINLNCAVISPEVLASLLVKTGAKDVRFVRNDLSWLTPEVVAKFPIFSAITTLKLEGCDISRDVFSVLLTQLNLTELDLESSNLKWVDKGFIDSLPNNLTTLKSLKLHWTKMNAQLCIELLLKTKARTWDLSKTGNYVPLELISSLPDASHVQEIKIDYFCWCSAELGKAFSAKYPQAKIVRKLSE